VEFLVFVLFWHGLCNTPGQERQMRSYLINKNVCFHYWLRKKVGKKLAFQVTLYVEKTILLFGREMFMDQRINTRLS
jgi:hypothetical protein